MGMQFSRKQIGWVLTRVKRMSGLEILFRVRERWIKYCLAKSSLGPSISFNVPKINWNRIHASVNSVSNEKLNSQLLDFRIYGFDWPKTEKGSIGWNLFLDGTDTTSVPAFMISYRSKEDLVQDIRFAWELNRLTWLIKITFFGSSNDRKQATLWFRDFLHNDKVGFGLRWNSMIELSIQSISIQLLTSLLDGLLADEDLKLSNEALSHRYFWIKKLPSKYSSANNHRLAELIALVSLSESSGDIISSLRWQNELIKELSKQTLSEGLNAELSADYHLFVLDLLITLNIMCPELKHSAQLVSYIKLMALATHELRTLNQTWPSFGDSDDASILATLLPSSNRAEFLEALSDYEAETHDEPISGKLRTFKESGYTAACISSSTSKISVLVDHGPIGFGKIAAHGHADTLAIWLVFNEIPIFVEAGTFSYHSSASKRDLFRSGWMHNSITVDGVSLSNPSGPFLWEPKRSAHGKLLRSEINRESAYIHVAADFPRVSHHKNGSIHRRFEINQRLIRILDSTSVGNSIESHFILSPSLKLARGNNSHKVVLTGESGIQVTFSTEQPNIFVVEPIDISPSYGLLNRTHRLTIVGKNTNKVSVEFDIVPSR
jgi:hypothetical protein